jgi:putative RNA 2'-phosphotransferase
MPRSAPKRATRHVALSKLLSYLLRHDPKAFGLELGAAGWVEFDALLAALAANGREATRDEVLEVVRTNDKQRFALSEDTRLIRAVQGHSAAVELDYAATEPPEILFHGTVARVVEAIRREGLHPGKRRHVHLSATVEQAERVGARRGRPVVLSIRAQSLSATGHAFYLAPNGVWLTARVPPEFIEP